MPTRISTPGTSGSSCSTGPKSMASFVVLDFRYITLLLGSCSAVCSGASHSISTSPSASAVFGTVPSSRPLAASPPAAPPPPEHAIGSCGALLVSWFVFFINASSGISTTPPPGLGKSSSASSKASSSSSSAPAGRPAGVPVWTPAGASRPSGGDAEAGSCSTAECRGRGTGSIQGLAGCCSAAQSMTQDWGGASETESEGESNRDKD
mmetsp:Transcript_35375/g.66683  ORF Transcript_35375/g.66683 Transcript_35375/m.66683 type:complete len:208 (+) Transcript_35375:2507-3130(+)